MRVSASVRWIATLALVAGIVLVSVVPGTPQPGDGSFVWLVAATPSLLQKCMHVVLYALLTTLLAWSLEDSDSATTWRRSIVSALVASGIGASLEWIQLGVPGRFGTLSDVLLNVAGAVIGLGVYRLILRHQRQNFVSFGPH